MKLIMPTKGLNTYEWQEGKSFMAICKVVPLISPNNEQKGFRIISLIRIGDKQKKEEKPMETLKSYAEEDELQ